MSIKVSISELSSDEKNNILKTLTLKCDGNENIEVFDVIKEQDGRNVILPFSFGQSFVKEKHYPLPINLDPPINFSGTLRPHQKKARDIAINSLTNTGSVILSAEPGFGKTITAIEMLCTINVPTIIFVKQTLILNQWKDALNKYARTKKVATISSKSKETGDVFLINPIILKKDTQFQHIDFSKIKLVIVDELHQIVTKVLHRAFFKFQPQFIIGLSATPYRPIMDAFAPAITWFFGKNIIGSKLFRNHIVYRVKTFFKPEIRTQPHTGKLDWSAVLTSQANDVDRNKMIVDIIQCFPERTWLILVKRVEHAKILQNMFMDKGLESETLVGPCQKFNKDTKILIGTTPKVGVGFDHAPIDALCMAADVLEYFEQFLGRCMRRENIVPIIIDFQDNFKPLLNHLRIRIQKYKEYGEQLNL